MKRWDLGTEQLTWSNNTEHQHGDYVRALDVSPVHQSSFITGSYDHTVKLWDSRADECVSTMDHGQPVEFCLISPSGALALSAGGNQVKLWDILSGGKLLHTFNNHLKNITGLCMNASGARLLSCGLDGMVKVYNMESLQVVYGVKYSGPCASLALAPDESKLIVGLVDGTLSVRNRGASDQTEDEDEDTKPSGGK